MKIVIGLFIFIVLGIFGFVILYEFTPFADKQTYEAYRLREDAPIEEVIKFLNQTSLVRQWGKSFRSKSEVEAFMSNEKLVEKVIVDKFGNKK